MNITYSNNKYKICDAYKNYDELEYVETIGGYND